MKNEKCYMENLQAVDRKIKGLAQAGKPVLLPIVSYRLNRTTEQRLFTGRTLLFR
jgi:hypothetical protein